MDLLLITAVFISVCLVYQKLVGLIAVNCYFCFKLITCVMYKT